MEHILRKQGDHVRQSKSGNVAIHLRNPHSYSCNQEAFMVKFVAHLFRISAWVWPQQPEWRQQCSKIHMTFGHGLHRWNRSRWSLSSREILGSHCRGCRQLWYIFVGIKLQERGFYQSLGLVRMNLSWFFSQHHVFLSPTPQLHQEQWIRFRHWPG